VFLAAARVGGILANSTYRSLASEVPASVMFFVYPVKFIAMRSKADFTGAAHIFLLCYSRFRLCYLTVDELGYRGDGVARGLRIRGRGVSDCPQRGRKIFDKPKIIDEFLA
jgi:hypothetical protein